MRKWFVSGIIALVSAVTMAPLVSAASPAGQGLEISPPVVEITANPGQTLTTSIRVRNVTTTPLFVNGTVDDFGANGNEDGNPRILLNETGATRYSLKYWVQGVPNLTLAPQELKPVTVTINVPANAEPGGHYGVVRFTGVPASLEGTGVSLTASIGTLILLKVNGQITDNLNAASFNAGRLAKNDTFTNRHFFEYGPVDFNVRLRNTGTVHEKAIGTVTVRNIFGKKVVAISVNPAGGNVLPDSVRRFNVTLPNKHLFGFYSAKLDMTYLGGSKKLSASTSFWVIPWVTVLIVLAILIVVFFLGRWALRRYNAHVIAAARRR